jgi:hypothetical protein
MEFSGWRARRQREADSRQVRVLDFERALSLLDPAHQQILLLTYNPESGCHPERSRGTCSCPFSTR